MRKTYVALGATAALGLCLLAPAGASALSAGGAGNTVSQAVTSHSAVTPVARAMGRHVGVGHVGRVTARRTFGPRHYAFRRGIYGYGYGIGGPYYRRVYYRPGHRFLRRRFGYYGLGLGYGYPYYGAGFGLGLGWGWPWGFGAGVGYPTYRTGCGCPGYYGAGWWF